MVPQTYPSVYNTYTNRTEMVVYELSSVVGMVRWTDYIPVKLTTSSNIAKENTTDNDGCIPTTALSSTTGKQAFVDYIPVFIDNSATDAWQVSATGYIPYGIASRAIAILKRSVQTPTSTSPELVSSLASKRVTTLTQQVRRLARWITPLGWCWMPQGVLGLSWLRMGTLVRGLRGGRWVLDGQLHLAKHPAQPMQPSQT